MKCGIDPKIDCPYEKLLALEEDDLMHMSCEECEVAKAVNDDEA